MAKFSFFEVVCLCGRTLHPEGRQFECPHCQRQAEIEWTIEGARLERPESYRREQRPPLKSSNRVEEGRDGDYRHGLERVLDGAGNDTVEIIVST